MALPDSAASLRAAGLPPAGIALQLDQHAPHAVQQIRMATLYHLLHFLSQLLNLVRRLVLHVSRCFQGGPELSRSRPQTALVCS